MELFQGLGHIAIVTKNLENSIAFYTKIGGKVLDRGDGHGPVDHFFALKK